MSNLKGDFIWYELMTDDADGAKRFYDDVVGWTVGAEASGDSDMDYRMIARGDGGFAGGMLVLTDAMKSGGARPGWLGYVHVPDVDAAVRAFTDAGGSSFMPPVDMDGVGRMAMVADPQGAPIYVMTPVPPADDSGGDQRRVLDRRSAAYPLERAVHHRSGCRDRLLHWPLRLDAGRRDADGGDGRLQLPAARRHPHRRGHAQGPGHGAPRLGLSISASTISTARRQR